MNRAAEVETSGVLFAVTEALLTLAVGSVNSSKLYPAYLLNYKRLILYFYMC